MATFDISPLLRPTLMGFDSALDTLHTAMQLDTAAYPPYNVLQLEEDAYRISLAVPGFSARELAIETRDGVVWIKGDPAVDPYHNHYLYRGIAAQRFQRTFQLPDHVRVKEARLEAGMLHVDLIRELPEELQPRRIEIEVETESRTRPTLEGTPRAA